MPCISRQIDTFLWMSESTKGCQEKLNVLIFGYCERTRHLQPIFTTRGKVKDVSFPLWGGESSSWLL